MNINKKLKVYDMYVDEIRKIGLAILPFGKFNGPEEVVTLAAKLLQEKLDESYKPKKIKKTKKTKKVN